MMARFDCLQEMPVVAVLSGARFLAWATGHQGKARQSATAAIACSLSRHGRASPWLMSSIDFAADTKSSE
jgi:hypothetical protein